MKWPEEPEDLDTFVQFIIDYWRQRLKDDKTDELDRMWSLPSKES